MRRFRDLKLGQFFRWANPPASYKGFGAHCVDVSRGGLNVHVRLA